MKAIVFVVRVDQTKWFRSIKKYPNSFEVFKGGVWDNHQPLVLLILMLPRPNYLYNHFVSSIFCPNPRYISPVAELLYFHCASLFRFSNFFFVNYLGIPCRAQNDCQEVLQGKKSWRILLSFYICIFPVSSWLLVQTIYDLILMLLKLQLSYFWQSTNYAIGCSLKLSKPFIKNINKIK